MTKNVPGRVSAEHVNGTWDAQNLESFSLFSYTATGSILSRSFQCHMTEDVFRRLVAGMGDNP